MRIVFFVNWRMETFRQRLCMRMKISGILAKKMITKLTKALGCDGYNIVQNNGEAAGQTVFHYHVHMIPRHKDDKVGLGWTMHELTEEEKEDVLSKIK